MKKQYKSSRIKNKKIIQKKFFDGGGGGGVVSLTRQRSLFKLFLDLAPE